jgi:hypothetical protein
MPERAIEEKDGACWLRLRVSPGSPRERLQGWHGEALKLSVQAPPEKGRANAAALRALARFLGLKPRQLALAAGGTSRDKTVRIEGIGRAELAARLRARLETSAP